MPHFAGSRFYLNSGSFHSVNALSAYEWLESTTAITTRFTFHTDKQISTWRCFTMVGARFQGNVARRFRQKAFIGH